MKERPILFSAPMVRAILAGTKTQTRRIVKPQPTRDGGSGAHAGMIGHEKMAGLFAEHVFGYCMAKMVACPYGAPGDRLWVREGFWCRNETCDHEMCGGCDLGSLLGLGERYADLQYIASPECCDLPAPALQQVIDPAHENHEHHHGSWWLGPPDDWDGTEEDHEKRGAWSFLPTRYFTKHPSIHMPRWACRIELDVTAVRVERLHDIDELGALAEGVDGKAVESVLDGTRGEYIVGSARDEFAELWRQINGAESWDANPWVWVVEFKRAQAQERAA